MEIDGNRTGLTRRTVLRTSILSCGLMLENTPSLKSAAGLDRVVVLPGKTRLRGWAGYGDLPSTKPRRRQDPPLVSTAAGPETKVLWSKESGAGVVTFDNAKVLDTDAEFSRPGPYVLRLDADDGKSKASAKIEVLVEPAPPIRQLDAVYTRNFKINSPLWNARARALIVNWIPHCIAQINRTDLPTGTGGIDNFVEAGKKLRGEPAGYHKGYVFSNAWVHQTVEAMSIALMIDAQGDAEILKAQALFRQTLEDWIPKILSAQEPDGYLQTAFTLNRITESGKTIDTSKMKHWDPPTRGDHEGYVAGYFLESAINHYLMTNRQDARLYNAAKKLADCWHHNLGPAPKKPWYDGHQEMEQALVRFGRFVNDMEGGRKGDKYIALAKFLLDSRWHSGVRPQDRSEYDQSHVPVVEQYEAVGHAVRAMYTYSGMADVAVDTHDPGYYSAVQSLYQNLVHRKWYLTGGVGSGETSEGFGDNYSLRNEAYCESCSTCGGIFFLWKLNLIWHDAKYVDLYEDSMYNALLGSTDLEAKNFYYDNPLDERIGRYAWHVCPCCVGNIPRTLLMLPTWVYAKSPSGVYVNLYVGSNITLDNVAGTAVEMIQATDYPWSGKVSITVNPQNSKRFAVRLRVPNRAVSSLYTPAPPGGEGLVAASVNGSDVKPVLEKGYAVITRMWKAGDRIELELPMQPQRVHATEKIAATRGKVALRYGPMLYNIEAADQDITKTLPADAPLTTEWKPEFLGGVMVIRSKFADGSPLLAIPNFARTNRLPATQVPIPWKERPKMPVSIVWMKEHKA